MKRIRKTINGVREFIAYLREVKKILFEKDGEGYSL
jgi:hypothetical protein